MGYNDVLQGILKGFDIMTDIGMQIGAVNQAIYEQFNQFATKPIGLANQYSRNMKISRENLNRAAPWNLDIDKNRIGTPIGALANPRTNPGEENVGWFIVDSNRKKYYDYLDYIDNVYYRGSKDILPNFNHAGVRDIDPVSLKDSKIGVVNNLNLSLLSFSAKSDDASASYANYNSNGMGEDTRIGMLGSYYLSNIIKARNLKSGELKYSAFQTSGDTMESGAKVNTVKKSLGDASITKGIYSIIENDYGLFGSRNVNDSVNAVRYGSYVKPNDELIGDIIPWSVTDNYYDSLTIKRDITRIQDEQSQLTQQEKNMVKLWFTDARQKTDYIHKYYPFGNYYSLSYSMGLLANSGGATQNYTAYSMLGYPLSKIKKDAGKEFVSIGELPDKEIKRLNVTELLLNDEIHGNVYKTITDKDGKNVNIWEPYPRKYYVTNGSEGTNYLDQMTASIHDYTKFHGEGNEHIVRINIVDPGNDNLWAARSIFQHLEAEDNENNIPLKEEYRSGSKTANSGVAFGNYRMYDPDTIGTRPDIIAKTNKLFSECKINSIIGRFHTTRPDKTALGARAKLDPISTAISQYGMSRGRNLLRKDHGKTPNEEAGNGYDNPYCRVWTYHNQYKSLQDTIRPFTNGESLDGTEVSRYRTDASDGFESGQKRLEKLGVKDKYNKLIQFAPTRNQANGITLKDQLKHLMFSIENLAWKGTTDNLEEDQKGPQGGRIMWFPPYNLSFDESTSVQWDEVNFIGRGEPIPTYINSKRTGNLSFDILIDHPSLINSWSGKGVGGMGVGDVDDVNSNEQMLLRFFAGCEVLGKLPDPGKLRQSQPEDEIEEELIEENPQRIVVPEPGEECVLSFFVFFPNNYSGVDDRSNTEDTFVVDGNSHDLIRPIMYLLKGVGSQFTSKQGLKLEEFKDILITDGKANENNVNSVWNEYIDAYKAGMNSEKWRNKFIGEDEIYSKILSNTFAESDIELTTIPMEFDNSNGNLTTNNLGNGYEISLDSSKGVSIIDGDTSSLKTYATNDSKNFGCNYNQYTSSKALPYRAQNKKNKYNKKTNNWAYRVDDEYANQNLNINNYADCASYSLNTAKGLGYIKNSSYFNGKDIDSYNLVGFTDAFVGLESNATEATELASNWPKYGMDLGAMDSENLITVTRAIKSIRSENSSVRVEIQGFASNHGQPGWNADLANNRRETLAEWLSRTELFRMITNKCPRDKWTFPELENPITTDSSTDDLNAKLGRAAMVRIFCTTEVVEDVNPTTGLNIDSNLNIADNIRAKKSEEAIAKVASMNNDEMNLSISTAAEVINSGLKIREAPKSAENSVSALAQQSAIEEKKRKQSQKEYQDKLRKTANSASYTDGQIKGNGYGNEYRYFESLAVDEPFLHNKLVEKIRFFDPAFHSITPEGFQARLTFLNQCTRQGNTSAWTDNSSIRSASNLAFGRPPVLVLRIGDFFNTRVVATNLNIQYKTGDGIHWDLNDEGIGVMPMYATVTMSLIFLGGSDLGGPIPRLQNAMSFNYYANTGVYDGRAEMVDYSDENPGSYNNYKIVDIQN